MFLASVGVAGSASADAGGLQSVAALLAKKGQIRVDGSLREWPSRSMRRVKSEGDDFSFVLAHDADALLLAVEVADAQVVRSARPGKRDDAVVLTLTLPRGQTTQVFLHPGADAIPAVGRLGSGPNNARLEVVEGPRTEGLGYVLEARIPWALIAGSENRHLARIALHYQDVDERGSKAAREGHGADYSARPLVLEGTHAAALHAFLASNDLEAKAPTLDSLSDVTGDTRLERVLVLGGYAVVVSADSPLRYISIPVVAAAEIRGAKMVRLFERGKSGLLITRRQRSRFGTREVLYVHRFVEPESTLALAIEVLREAKGDLLKSSVSFEKGQSGQRAIVVSLDPEPTLSGQPLLERAPNGVIPVLLPAGPYARSRYTWEVGHFAVVHEDNPHAHSDQPQPAQPTASQTLAVPAQQGRPSHDALVSAFVEQRGLAGVRQRFRTRCNVAEDSRSETLTVLGRDLLVTGEGFAAGQGYFFFSLPVVAPEDVLHLFTADVTGDGRAEVFVRLRERIGDVSRDLLRGYMFDDDGFREILAAEIWRALGEQRIANRVKVVGAGRRQALVIEPGMAYGWDAASYPFDEDALGSHDDLLLPFRDEAVRYEYRDGRLSRQPR